jgi:hypothetical protein
MNTSVVLQFKRLQFADVIRDGGSYVAIFETDAGKEFGLWLQRSRMPDENGRHHRRLFAYHGTEKPLDSIPMLTGSDDEALLLESLGTFLCAPVADMNEVSSTYGKWWNSLGGVSHVYPMI